MAGTAPPPGRMADDRSGREPPRRFGGKSAAPCHPFTANGGKAMQALTRVGAICFNSMPKVDVRLYFHLVSDDATIRDLEGVEVDNIDQALAEALRAVDEIRGEDPAAARDWSGWSIHIADASGQVVLSVDLGRTIQ